MQRNSGESERLKGTTRMNKHIEAQQIYKCECGKDYLTFSALYLHVNLKHGLRLTTKRTEGNHIIERSGSKTTVTYLLKETQNISQNQYNNQKKVQNDPPKIPDQPPFQSKIKVINQYLESLKNNCQFQTVPVGILYSVMQNLIEYFLALNKLRATKPETEQEEADITLYFNEFTTYYMPNIRKSFKNAAYQISPIVHSLNIFYKWLKQSKKTEVKLLCHDDYIKNAASKQS